MTFNECKKYHELVWQEMIEEIRKIAKGSRWLVGRTIADLKVNCIREITKYGGVPKPSGFYNCYLCDYYDSCLDCPLGNSDEAVNCELHGDFVEAMRKGDYEKAIEIAKQIRDVFK